jgi:hypothetical protein
MTILNWLGTVLLSVFVSAGLWAAFGKKLVSHLLERESDKFRADLKLEGDTQIERLRSSLQLTAFEQQVRFSRLHSRRATLIAELYKLLNDVPAFAANFILNSPSDSERERIAREKVFHLFGFIEDNRIYFPPHVCDLLDAFSGKLRRSVVFVGVYWKIEAPTGPTRAVQNKVILDAVTALETDLPVLKKELEEEFRKLLGV